MDKIYRTYLRGIVMMAVVLCTALNSSFAQEPTKVIGKVTDAATGEPLPFVSVYFKGTTAGATTSFEGEYSLESKHANDTLVASCVGYKMFFKPIQLFHFQQIDILLEPASTELSEVVIVPGENPAEVLLKKVVDHKDMNDPDKVDHFQCEAYTKLQIDVNNITDKLMGRKLLKPFNFIFDFLDTSSVNGKVYLPVMISESFSDIYFRQFPRERKEIIKATRISGVENNSVSQFMGNLAQSINVYNNYITLFDKNLPSPVSGLGLVYYRYYLVDSTFIGNHWCYNLMFKPRRVQENAFTGNVWINDTTFAVKKLEMRIGKEASINFIDDMVILQEFEKVNDTQWMVVREQMIADFNLVEESKKTAGFFGSRTVLFSNYNFEKVVDKKIYSIPVNIRVLEDANLKNEEFWKSNRPEQLSYREAAVYRMADTLNNMPLFNTYVDIIQTILTGYYVKGNFEWGPYASTYSFNQLEGNRIRIGGRTSNDFSKRLMIDGYVAYGFKDTRLKYHAGFLYMLGKMPDKVVSASYKYDMEQVGESENAFREDFFLNSLFRRNPQDKLTMVKQFKATYKHEWFTGFSTSLSLINRQLFSQENGGFSLFNSAISEYELKNEFSTNELVFDVHLGLHEKVIGGEFERTVIGSPYPVFDFQYAYGTPGLLNGDYEFHRAQLRVSQWFNWMSAGWTKYSVETGKIWGTVPYPLLKIQPGNETFWYDENAFSLMNYYEFISDEYLSFLVTHHFDGFFLSRIPLIRLLKWRETVQFRGVFGHTSAKNMIFNELPAGSYFLDLKKPYAEVGAGIENIFRFLRVDAFWRMTHHDHSDINKFGIMVSASVTF